MGCEYQDEFDPKAPRESTARKWTDGIVYYKFDENSYFDIDTKNRIKECIYDFENVSSLQFIEIKNTKGIKYFCTIKQAQRDSCSNIGMHKNMFLYLSNWKNEIDIRHEIGHLIGLEHEHQRSDRNKYIKIRWNNIIENEWHNFNIIKHSLIPNNLFEYDIRSFMHYSPISYSKNKQLTIQFKNIDINLDNATIFIFNNYIIKFTKIDIQKIQYLYPL
jgi:hypothetical protein